METTNYLVTTLTSTTDSPYSLGKLIEWKHRVTDSSFDAIRLTAPYSLGKLIEWKQYDRDTSEQRDWSPYSLGKLIDWKLRYF